MKKLALVLAFVAAVAGRSTVARAELGTADVVPAATLLLPYFAVDYLDPSAPVTSFTINNASATAVVAHVTLWTDEGIPTFNFDVYLTGYDVQQVNLNALFATGTLPITADFVEDSGDTPSPDDGISNMGTLSQDINFSGTTGPCSDVYSSPELSQAELRHIRAAHTGRRSAILNGCASAQYGDSVARGYVTVDTVTACSLLNPSASAYFDSMASIASYQNVLWGDASVTDGANNSETGRPLVHVETCIPGNGFIGYVGNGSGLCPFGAGDYTFYGRLHGFTAADQREPLSTIFATRYVNGGAFTGGTDLIVWRDTKLAPTGPNGKHNCTKDPSWYPLAQSDVVGFDEQENPTDLCFLTDNFSPAIGGEQPCFPLATQRVSVASGNAVAEPIEPPSLFGWLFLNLSHTVAGDLQPGVAQAWVETTMSANGRFAVGYQAIALDNALAPASGLANNGLLIPPP